MNELINLHPEVASALGASGPVVALESTVIAHGLPHPLNLETAINMQHAVREAGAVPATVAIIQGKIYVGLTGSQLEYLATRPRSDVRKCSRRDLAVACSNGEDGATTVAGTMILAHLAGIKLFATGGIGGVHRNRPYDVSADLFELGRTPVAVVCSGVKSILDLERTREMLESLGVAVLGYRTEEMPAFFSVDSGLPVDKRVNSAAEAAATIKVHSQLNLGSGILVTVPVPESNAYKGEEIESAIIKANEEAGAAGIHGAEATPWLLNRINEITGGKSVQSNLALLINNARIAGAIAAKLSVR
ncbi:MAG: pseudouridine-5'-phosphate glycosidase [Anaerolineae bacterium]|nr:MAG: pseudouridine-5'-phosphate glycosidase [Anaerolineae bacterium]